MTISLKGSVRNMVFYERKLGDPTLRFGMCNTNCSSSPAKKMFSEKKSLEVFPVCCFFPHNNLEVLPSYL